jgi:Flp pilus assembly protein TadB
MSASHPCDPGEPGELSSREKKILAAIEQEIHTTDPALARHLERRKRPKTRTPLRAAIRHGTLLIIALVILIVATAVLPSDSWIVLGLLTTVLLVPWILLFPANARPRKGRRR